MKKQIILLSAVLFLGGASMAQCTIDPNAQTKPGISPTPSQLPCIITGVPYNQTIQVQNLTGAGPGGFVKVDSMQLTSVTGLPNGITWTTNPAFLDAGANGCLTFSGTTTDTAGTYPLSWMGTVWYSAPFIGNSSYNGNLTRFGGAAFRYSLTIINQGDICAHDVGINDLSPDLNTAMQVYPNPNNGVFEFKLNAAKRVNGEMVIVDMTGRTIYSEKLDVFGLYNTTIDLSKFARGLYTLQLRTADGFASKRISVQ